MTDMKARKLSRKSFIKEGAFFAATACVSSRVLGADDGEKNPKSDERTLSFLNDFFHKILVKRDVPLCIAWFCSLEEYLSLDEIEDSPEDARKTNYLHQRDMFIDDCNKIIDMLPKANVDFMHLVKIEPASRLRESNMKNGNEYKTLFTYGEGGSRFLIVFPTLVKVGEKWKFATRFWVPIRFVL